MKRTLEQTLGCPVGWTPGDSDLLGLWSTDLFENQVISHWPICLCIWVCSALRSAEFEADCWRLESG